MRTIIFLSNSKLKVLRGEFKKKYLAIKAWATYEMPENSLINGVITDENALKAILQQVVADEEISKEVHVVLDSSLILFKLCRLPELPYAKMIGLVKNEMAEFEDNYEDLIYDYSLIKGLPNDTEGVAVLACAAERRLIAGLLQVFADSGIKLSGVDLAINSAIRLTEFVPQLQNGTFILANVIDSNMMSALFIQGAYVFSNRSRLLAKQGTDEYLIELSSKISSLLQFHKSQKYEQDIEKIYLAGLTADVMENAKRVLGLLPVEIADVPEPSLKIDLDSRDKTKRIAQGQVGAAGFKVSDYLYCTGSLLGK